ncbi:MAG TPA: hypothetical protein VHX44_09050 [Planctomycetota bacterium]|nr:hypothetical protein [Planctomycetota bacterium]
MLLGVERIAPDPEDIGGLRFVAAHVRSSLTLVARDPAAFTRVFCQRLFLHAPEIRALLPAVFVREPARLIALIQRAVNLLNRRDMVVEGLQTLGRLHAGYAALPSF